jgi:hypothetical protein
MGHAFLLQGFDSHQDAAKAIADLRYDGLRDLLNALAERLGEDAQADSGRGRPKLAQNLDNASVKALAMAQDIGRAWAICAPFMEPSESELS